MAATPPEPPAAVTAPQAPGLRVALIKIWQGTLMPPRPPLGILFVGGALKQAGHQVRVFHWTKDEALAALGRVEEFSPQLVGFSIITGDPLDLVLTCARRLRQASPGAKVMLGGVHATVEPAQCLAEPEIDYLIQGEGEVSAVLLADALAAGRPVESIPGLAFKRQGGEMVINPRPPLERHLERFRADWSLVDIEKYIAPEYEGVRRMLFGYVASRGCPHACGFCYNHFFNQRTWRKPPAKAVIADVNALVAQHDLGGVFFYDDNFTANKQWALEVIGGLATRGMHIETRIDYLDAPFLEQLVERGVGSLFIGVESGSDRVLGLLNKGFVKADTQRVVELLSRFPGYIMLSFIVGVPTETLAEYHQTLELVLWCQERLPRLGFTLGFYLPYPGTPLYQLCVQRGFTPPDNMRDWEQLDRWGRTNMVIPWTEGYRLTPAEVADLRRTLRELKALRGRRGPWAGPWRALLRARFRRSATPLGGFLAALTRGVYKLREIRQGLAQGWPKACDR